MTQVDSGLRRVTVYADAAGVDLTLPAGVPLAVLIPAIVAQLPPQDRNPAVPVPDRLSVPANQTLDGEASLSQHGIRDGAVLLLTRTDPAPPAPRFDDVVEGISTAVGAVTRHRQPGVIGGFRALVGSWLAGMGAVMLIRTSFDTAETRNAAIGVAAGAGCTALTAAVIAYRLDGDRVRGPTLALWANGFAAVAGFVAVPGGPAAPNVLLAAMATATTSMLAIRLAGGRASGLATVSALAGLAAAAALARAMTATSFHVIGSGTAATSIVVLQTAVRVSAVSAGLSPQLQSGPMATAGALAARTVRAHRTMTSLVVVLSTAAALGASCLVAGVYTGGAPRLGAVALAAVTGMALLLRARSHTDRFQVLALVAGGTIAVSAAVAAAAAAAPRHTCLAAAVVATVALCCLCAPTPTLSPLARRGLELLEHVALAAIAPLACWVCGMFSAGQLAGLI